MLCYPQTAMATADILNLLITEHDKLDRAIEALETQPKRRGRPPGRRGPGRPPKAGTAEIGTGTRRRRPHMSAEARRRQSERMKRFWAARRKQTATKQSKKRR